LSDFLQKEAREKLRELESEKALLEKLIRGRREKMMIK